MSPLLDVLGPAARCPAIKSALARLARQNDTERGIVSTPPEVVNTLLDLAGYTPDRPLTNPAARCARRLRWSSR
ncbi:hypothetical protein [Allochromatium tepidum]|uniref:Uncharacterized protein n=1 Tax=Allochromatium tepidum TaxID=553982 RepID=A0ABN6GIW6_9GAMM|nr:hypothetical protein [Allochromatium tepidum]BCU07876.1 hypothetical protein Atep_25530 [Allochromatium tepidum]